MKSKDNEVKKKQNAVKIGKNLVCPYCKNDLKYYSFFTQEYLYCGGCFKGRYDVETGEWKGELI